MKRFTSGGSLDKDIQFTYDGFGRRVKKFVDDAVLDDATYRYIWDGWTLLAEADGSGNMVRQYTYHPERLDHPLAMRKNNTTTYFHLDGQGNVYALTNTSGTKVTEYRYRAWGDRYVTGVGQSVESPFTYKGAQEDYESGLIYMRNRYYSPRLERFLNEDPIGVAGGLNVYSFTGADPVNREDRLGLCCVSVIIAGGMAGGGVGAVGGPVGAVGGVIAGAAGTACAMSDTCRGIVVGVAERVGGAAQRLVNIGMTLLTMALMPGELPGDCDPETVTPIEAQAAGNSRKPVAGAKESLYVAPPPGVDRDDCTR